MSEAEYPQESIKITHIYETIDPEIHVANDILREKQAQID